MAATLTGKAAGSRDGATDEPADGDRVHRPGTLLALGLAGGLAPGLEAGDVVLTEAWRGAAAPHPEGPTAAPRAIAAVARALAAAGIDSHRGPGVTVDAPFHDAGARDRLHAATGALTVEMEGARWAALAADAGVDFASVRVISDRADLRLPRPRHELLDAGGQVRWEAWLAAVATATDRDPADALRDLHAARREWIAAMRALERVGGALAKLLG